MKNYRTLFETVMNAIVARCLLHHNPLLFCYRSLETYIYSAHVPFLHLLFIPCILVVPHPDCITLRCTESTIFNFMPIFTQYTMCLTYILILHLSTNRIHFAPSQSSTSCFRCALRSYTDGVYLDEDMGGLIDQVVLQPDQTGPPGMV